MPIRPVSGLLLLLAVSCEPTADPVAATPTLPAQLIYFGHGWAFGQRSFHALDDVVAELDTRERKLRESGSEPRNEPKRREIMIPCQEIVVLYRGVPEGAEDYEDCVVQVRSERVDGFTPEDLLWKLNEATLDTLRDADHVYPEFFQVTGSQTDGGVPIVRMECGS